MAACFDAEVIEARERLIAQREGIAWKRIDRSWVRGKALRELRAGQLSLERATAELVDRIVGTP
jgi:hypothetical protein